MFFYAILLGIFMSANASAQSDSVLKRTDRISYDLFNKGDWNELITFSENALKKKIDFLLLRVRLGIAYYKTGKCFDAVDNLKKAFDLGYETPILIEYLYYSYLQAGREEDADFYFYKLPQSKRDRIKPQDNSFMNEIHAFAGYGLSDDENKNGDVDIAGPDNVYGEQLINGNEFYVNAGFKQLPLRWLNITYSYNYFDLKKIKQISFNNEKISDSYSQQQQQFYVKYDIRAGDGLVISPAGQYVFTDENTVYADYDSVTYSYNAQNMTYDSLKYFYSLSQRQSIQDNFIISLLLSKQKYIFKTGVHGSFSYLNGNHQTQAGAFLKSYPKKKNTLYTFTDINLQWQNGIANFIFYQSAGGKVYKDLWGEAFLTIGKINNYNEQNGLIVFNNPDVITFKFGAEFNYYFNKYLSASLIYTNQQREKNYVTYKFGGISNGQLISNPEYSKLNYSLNTFLAGLKLYF